MFVYIAFYIIFKFLSLHHIEQLCVQTLVILKQVMRKAALFQIAFRAPTVNVASFNHLILLH